MVILRWASGFHQHQGVLEGYPGEPTACAAAYTIIGAFNCTNGPRGPGPGSRAQGSKASHLTPLGGSLSIISPEASLRPRAPSSFCKRREEEKKQSRRLSGKQRCRMLEVVLQVRDERKVDRLSLSISVDQHQTRPDPTAHREFFPTDKLAFILRRVQPHHRRPIKQSKPLARRTANPSQNHDEKTNGARRPQPPPQCGRTSRASAPPYDPPQPPPPT